MTLPTRTTPTRVKGDYTFVYAKAVGDADYELIGQMTEASGSQEESMDEWRTVGSGLQTESQDTTYPVSMTILVPQDPQDAARLLGVKDPAPWLGSEKLNPDPTVDVDIKFVDYSTAGDIVHTEYWDDTNWDKLERTTTSDGYKQWKLSGQAAEVYDKPAAGT